MSQVEQKIGEITAELKKNLEDLHEMNHTGVVSVQVTLNQGGIRSAKLSIDRAIPMPSTQLRTL